MPNVDLVMDASNSTDKQPGQGAAIALSGGGYRAMLFHTGALWRLGQMGFFQDQPLQRTGQDGASHPIGKLERVSSVSGGSITAATLALAFPSLEQAVGTAFDQAYAELVVRPIRGLAGTTLAGTTMQGVLQVLKNIVLPGRVSDHIAADYDRLLFAGKTLQHLPDRVRFVFNASNLQSGAVWRFSKPSMRDWRVGEVRAPALSLARVVAASSAFPPVLAPAMLTLKDRDFTTGSGADRGSLQHAPFTTAPTLADGGVYDNLGLETCYKRYKTLFVSNAGKPFAPQAKVHRDWLSIANRCLDVMNNQVLSLRKRLLLQALISGERHGAFWDIQQEIGVHQCGPHLPCPSVNTTELSQVPTDLAAKAPQLQERLINWGYAVADASVRTWFNRNLAPAAQFPYPDRGV